MAKSAAFAMFYLTFAIMFAFVNVVMQDVPVRSSMKQAVVDKYINLPYSFLPEMSYKDVSLPSELYAFLWQVFIPVTFAEKPVNGQADGFCNAGHPCYIDQGDCDYKFDCQGDLTCSDESSLYKGVMVNGEYWDEDELTDWCKWQGRPVNLTLDGARSIPSQIPKVQRCDPHPTNQSILPPCCWDDRTDQPIFEIFRAKSPDYPQLADIFVQVAPFIGRSNCPASVSPSGDCCAKTSSDPLTVNETEQMEIQKSDSRPVTVGSFNRVLMVRTTAKRYKYKPGGSEVNKAFEHITPEVLSGGGDALSAVRDNEKEEFKDSFASTSDPSITYEWEVENSYNRAGGYIEYFAPRDGPSSMGAKMERMQADGIFDKTLATFTVDMLMFNANIDTFMYIVFAFTFHPSGTCTSSIDMTFSNLSENTGLRMIAK
jgi:hypothetical protein